MKHAGSATKTVEKPTDRKAAAQRATHRAAKAAATKPTETQGPDLLGPRLSQILTHRIQPWRREQLGEEEAQLAEIKRRPVRNRYDAEEAKRRLGIKPVKRSRVAVKPKQPTA
jgi:hypothetical protein